MQTKEAWFFKLCSFGDKHKGLVNLTFAYLSILTACMKDGFLRIVTMMPCDTLALCVGTMLLGSLINLSGAAKAWKGRRAASWFVCVCCLSVWSHGSLTLSFLFSLFFYFFIYLSPYYFFLFFSPLFFSKLGLTPSWNKDTPLFG